MALIKYQNENYELPRKENRMIIKQDLKAMQKGFRELGKKMDKYKQAIEKDEKAPAKKTATKNTKTVKAKPKSTSAKKPARKKPVNKAK
jgi:hypothetical protein